MVDRILLTEDGRVFQVKDQDAHTQFGVVKLADIKKAKLGSTVKSNTGKEFIVIEPNFLDLFKKIKRGPQIIPLKDVGAIIAETGINKESKVLDAGAGSGALACFLARLVKSVTSYEIRDDFADIAEGNVKKLQLRNVTIKRKDIYQGITEKNLDLIVLDLPEPWQAIKHAHAALKPGAFLVNYSPTTPQVGDFVNQLEGFTHIKTIELIEREWDVKGRKVRPKSQGIGHSGFLTFCRRL